MTWPKLHSASNCENKTRAIAICVQFFQSELRIIGVAPPLPPIEMPQMIKM